MISFRHKLECSPVRSFFTDLKNDRYSGQTGSVLAEIVVIYKNDRYSGQMGGVLTKIVVIIKKRQIETG